MRTLMSSDQKLWRSCKKFGLSKNYNFVICTVKIWIPPQKFLVFIKALGIYPSFFIDVSKFMIRCWIIRLPLVQIQIPIEPFFSLTLGFLKNSREAKRFLCQIVMFVLNKSFHQEFLRVFDLIHIFLFRRVLIFITIPHTRGSSHTLHTFYEKFFQENLPMSYWLFLLKKY